MIFSHNLHIGFTVLSYMNFRLIVKRQCKAAKHYHDGKFDISFLTEPMKCAANQKPKARIYKLFKNKIDADIYLTDNNGKILFNSKEPRSAGCSFTAWNDVARCLRGEYGARASKTIPPAA